MTLKRIFLGWDEPLLNLSASALLKQVKSKVLFDLSNVLVVVSTSHAIRILGNKVTEIVNNRGGSVVVPKIVTPHFFLKETFTNIPSETQRILLWIEAVKINIKRLKSLYPENIDNEKPFNWYLDKVEKIIEFADTLASMGLTIEKLILNNPAILQHEKELFTELSLIENTYFELINRHGFEDTNKAKINNALNPNLPVGITKVIFIAVTEPLPILTETIKALSYSTDLEIWINAPSNFDVGFDTFGRPIPHFWRNINSNINDLKQCVTLFDTPGDLASDFVDIVLQINGSDNEKIDIEDMSIIMPDMSLETAIRHSFLKHGIKTYNPSGIKLRNMRPCILFSMILEFVLEQDYRSLANLIRNVDFLGYISSKIDSLDYSKIFSVNDYLQNSYMPISFEDMLNAVEMENKKGGLLTDKSSLTIYSKVISFVNDWLNQKCKDKNLATEFALSKVIEIYNLVAPESIDPGLRRDWLDSVKMIQDIVIQCKECLNGNMSYNERDIVTFTTKRMQNTILYPSQEDGTLPLRGWFELQWEDKKKYTFIIGMNEGMVPQVTTNNLFLPDSLRQRLGLPSNETRFVRDFCILYAVISGRQENPINFVVMKTSPKGEYLKPSRLLLHTSEPNDFYERLNYLFKEKSTASKKKRKILLNSNRYPLHYKVPFKKLKEHKLSVTDFKDYLECPFRFHLRKNLGYEEEIDDTKTGLDSRNFGSICHDILMLLGNGLKENVTPKELKELLDKRLAYEKTKFAHSIPIEFSFYSLSQRLNKALELMLKENENNEWEINDLEKDLNITIDSKKLGNWLEKPIESEISCSIKGRIDRIDISRDGKSLKIIDYKTGSVSANPQREHYNLISARTNIPLTKEYARFELNGKEYVWTDLQLPLYAIMLQEYPEYRGIKINNLAYFIIPKAVMGTAIATWDGISELELNAAKKCTAQIIVNIANGIFWPPSDKLKYDNYQKMLYNTCFNDYISFEH